MRALSRDPALIIAIEVGDKECFRALVEHGADASFCNQYGTSAMHRAAEQPDPEWLRELLDHGGNPDQINVGNKHYRNSTPIYYAIYQSRSETIRLLIERGASLSHRDEHGFTPLHRAVEASLFADALIMLKAGADPTIATVHGKTLFQIDAMRTDEAIIYPDPKKVDDLHELRQYLRDHAFMK